MNNNNQQNTINSNSFSNTFSLSNNSKAYLPFIIIFCFPVLLYLQTLTFGFTHFDDDFIILNNLPFLSDFHNAHLAFLTDAFIGKSSSFYRPMQTLTYMTDIQLSGGNNAWMYHLSNVLLLGLISCVLFLLLRKFSIQVKPALLGTLIYCSHPLFVSTVAWIPARGDLLLTLFSLLSFLFFIEHLQKKKNEYLYLHWATFTIALLCKETAIFLPFLFVLYYFLFSFEKRFEKKYLLNFLLYAISGMLLLLLRVKAIGGFSNKNDEVGLMSALSNLQTIPESLAMFFIPFKIAPFPSFSLFKTFTGVVVIIFILILFYKNKERSFKEKIFGISWFVLLLLPTMIYKNTHIDYLNHRFLLPLIGILLFILFIFPKKWFEKADKNISWLMIFVIVFLSSITIVNSRSYTDATTFYISAISLNTNSALAYFNKGCLEKDVEGKLQDAINDYTKAIEINPDYFKAYNNRGFAYGTQGLINKAIADFTKAIELKPDYADALINRGGTYFQLKIYDKAIDDFTKAIEIEPEFATTYYNRANVYSSIGDFENAINDFTKATKLKPDYAEAYYNRGNLYCSQRLFNNAISDYTKTIELTPDKTDAYYNRGTAYNAQNLFDKAIIDFSQVIERNPNDASAYFNRGNAYHKIGMNKKACPDFVKAAELGLNGAKDFVAKFCNGK